MHVRCIEGISYGVDGWEELGTHVRVCGATFWEEISNWSGTYQAIMDVVGKHSENGLQQAKQETVDDIVRFMQGEAGVLDESGNVNWPELINFLSKRER